MKRLLMMVLFLTMPVGMACGSGGNGTPDSGDSKPGDVVGTPDVSDEGPDQGTEVTADVPPSGNCIPPVGTDFRFTHLSVVQPTDPDGTPIGTAIVAVDTVGAGVGEPVLVLRQGIAAAQVLGVTRPPIRSIIAGIVDHVNVSR